MRRLGSFRPEKALGEGRPEARAHLDSGSGGCVCSAHARERSRAPQSRVES